MKTQSIRNVIMVVKWHVLMADCKP